MACNCKVVWKNNRIFDGFDKSGRLVNIDASAMYGGDDTAPSPMDLLAIGLSGCTGIVMTIAMEDMNIAMDSLQVHGSGERSANEPGEYVQLGVCFEAKGADITHEIMQKAICDYVILKAPVYATLSKSCPISVDYMLEGKTFRYDAHSDSFNELNK